MGGVIKGGSSEEGGCGPSSIVRREQRRRNEALDSLHQAAMAAGFFMERERERENC